MAAVESLMEATKAYRPATQACGKRSLGSCVLKKRKRIRKNIERREKTVHISKITNTFYM